MRRLKELIFGKPKGVEKPLNPWLEHENAISRKIRAELELEKQAFKEKRILHLVLENSKTSKEDVDALWPWKLSRRWKKDSITTSQLTHERKSDTKVAKELGEASEAISLTPVSPLT